MSIPGRYQLAGSRRAEADLGASISSSTAVTAMEVEAVMARAIHTSRQKIATTKKLGIHMPSKRPTLIRSNPVHQQVATAVDSNRGATVRHRLYMEVATVSSTRFVPCEQQSDVLQLGGTT